MSADSPEDEPAVPLRLREVLEAVDNCLQDRYGPRVKGITPPVLPAGLRLEMHPETFSLLRRDSEAFAYGSRLEDKFQVPVKVTADLEPRTWRLVIVTEEVLLSGGVREQ